jgi:hypothetical protein
MTYSQFAHEFSKWNPSCRACYIAIIPQDDYHYDLEVEISADEISGTWDTGTKDLDKARKQADRLEEALRSLNPPVVVFRNREDWRKHVDCLD